MENLEGRKKDHIELAFQSRTTRQMNDSRFHYEPLLKPHPDQGLPAITFLGKELRAPLWVSSMTGGTKLAGIINRNLATACHEFGMGMGLGSCRIIMDSDTYFEDFNMRGIIGDNLPFWANLGIAQIEELVALNRVDRATDLVDKLQADGLIIHINPMQEWFQPEGDILNDAPLETLKRFLDRFPYPLIVKEVGQGMGPESLHHLLQLPLQAIEFGAFGGTNFAKLELMRDGKGDTELFEPLSYVGEDAESMVGYINRIVSGEGTECRELIISGGIRTFLDGYYLMQKSSLPAVYGMASTFLTYAREDYEQLRKFVHSQVKGLEMAATYLTLKE